MKKKILVTLDLPDNKDVSWLPEEVTITDWIARGMIVLIREASESKEA